MSEFWDNIEKARQERIEYEKANGILPSDHQSEPPRRRREPTTVNRRNQHTGPTVTDEQAREMRRRYEAGESSPKIAADFGVTPFVTRAAITRAGGTIAPHGAKLAEQHEIPADVVRTMVDQYREGKSLNDLGKLYDVSPWLVRKALLKLGVELRSKSDVAKLRESRSTPEQSDEQRKAELVAEYAADVGILKMIDGEWVDQPSCRCYRCGKLLTADNVIIDRYGPRQSRPVCEECKG